MRIPAPILALAFLCAAVATALTAPDFSNVPGVVLNYVESPTALEILFGQAVYTTDPSIVVLPNGDYVASCAIFGSGSGSTTSGMTSLYRSSDGGETWTSLGTLPDLLRASLFWHDGALYLYGAKAEGMNGRVRKSLDNGTTWTTPTNTTDGQMSVGGPGTPSNPVVFAGRLWCGAGSRVFSAPATADLLQANSWTLSNSIPTNANWFGGLWQGWSEGQVVASPETGITLMPKVRAFPNSALFRCNPSTGGITFDPEYDFVDIPGCEKKFGATWDPVSGKFFVLSSAVLPFYKNYAGLETTPELIRNTAAVITSPDLYHWEVEKLFLHSDNIDYEGFQYFNFDFDGDDMVVASRTAFDVGETLPPRGHDSNLITFHKIENVRSLSRDHFLILDNGGDLVSRFESTQNSDAPLGDFPLGALFAGAPLDAPDGLAQAPDGTVYIRETGGRILRFDAAGNFLEVAASSPVAFQAGPLPITQPPAGERSWVRPDSGSWRDLTNWYYWGRPDSSTEFAVFGSAATGPLTVDVADGSHRWDFDTNSDFEGWTTANITGATVAGGALGGTGQSDPQISRTGLAISGDRYPEVRVRLRIDVPSADVDFYWGTTLANSFTVLRRIRVPYTGNGAYQDLVFPVAGQDDWDGQVITSLRVDPFNDTAQSGATFEIDSIETHLDSYRIAGMRFRNTEPYTISGDGALRIEPQSGPGAIEVQAGSHTLDVFVDLHADTTLDLASGTTLDLQKAPRLNDHWLAIDGPGTVLSPENLAVGAGHLSISGGATLAHSGVLDVASSGQLLLDEGTVSLAPAVTIAAGAILGGEGRIDGTLLAGGMVSPGFSAGILSAGSATLTGSLAIEIDGPASDRLEIDGALDIDAATLEITTLAGGATAPYYVLAEYGTLAGAGTFASVTGVPPTFAIDYAYDTGGSNPAIALVGAYQAWIDGSSLPAPGDDTLDADPNGDGVQNGVAFVTGAADATSDATSLLPFATRDATGLVFTFRRIEKAADLTAAAEYGADLLHWNTAIHGSAGITITETEDGFGPGIDRIDVRLPDTLAVGDRLFVRLLVE